ncbi:aldehyde dehydrogenase family protein [Bradyrhizobium sp. 170]|nr:aldehyde dehydrogenase family protein [Bradyrhizobium sp. 170]
MPHDDEKEVPARCNNLERRRGAYVYTCKPNRTMRLAGRLECGVVAVNAQFTGAIAFSE